MAKKPLNESNAEQTERLSGQPLKIAMGLKGRFSALAGGDNNLLLRHIGNIAGREKTRDSGLAGAANRHLAHFV